MEVQSQFIEMLKGKAINGKISDLVAPKIANVKKTYSPDDTIQYIDISSINAEDYSVSQFTEYSVKDAPSRAQQCVKYGDLLVSTVRPINRNIAIVDKDLDNLVASTGFCVLRPNDGMLNYLLSIVLSDDYTDAMCDKANGGVYPAVNNGDVLNYQIHIPDDDLAKRVSLVRQQADKSKFVEFKSQFIEMFGDTHKQSENSRQWKDVVKIINGKDYKSVQVDEGGYPVYGTGGEMARASEYLCPENSILLGRKGTIDKPLLINEKYWNVDTAFGAVPDAKFLDYIYFYWHCKFTDFKILNKGTTLPSTTKVDLLNLWVKIPEMSQQKEFAAIVGQADKSKYKLKGSIATINKIYKLS